MMSIKLFGFLLVVFAANCFSQGGSNYSQIGIGDWNFSSGAIFEGIGGSAIAVSSEYGINIANPAMLSSVTTTRLQAGYRFNQQLVSSSTSELAQNNGKLDGFLASFCFDQSRGIVGVFGLVPVSSVNFFNRTSSTLNHDGTTVATSSLQRGVGGVSSVVLGSSWRIDSSFSIGALGFFGFGSIGTSILNRIDAVNSTSSYNYLYNDISTSGMRLGVSYVPVEKLTIGAFAMFTSQMSIRQRVLFGNIDSQLDTGTSTTRDITSPFVTSFGLGLSYGSGKFVVAGDVTVDDFSSMTFRKTVGSELKPQSRLSVGIARVGTPAGAGVSYLDRVAFRFGFNYRQLYYSVSGTDINEIGGSYGMSMPISSSSVVDAAITFGKRGTTSNKLLAETFARMTFTLSIGEIWFQPLRRE